MEIDFEKHPPKVGDTVLLRCGRIVVEDIKPAARGIEINGQHWFYGGEYFYKEISPFDIIGIERKPEPVVVERWANVYLNLIAAHESKETAFNNKGSDAIGTYKIKIVDGVPSIERVEKNDGQA